MSEENSRFPGQDESSTKPQIVDNSRRSFSKLGIAAPVIMTLANRPAWGTGTKVDCQVSGFTSIHVKGNDLSGVSQTGSCGFSHCTPKYWHDNCGLTGYSGDKWPRSCAPGQDDGTISGRTSSGGSKIYKCYKVNKNLRPSWTPVSASTPDRIREDYMDNTSRKCFISTAFGAGSNTTALWTTLHNDMSSNDSLCLAALLSAKKKEEDFDQAYADFPLSVADCKKIYTAVSSNTSCDLGSGAVWTAQQCVDFLKYVFV